MHTFSASVVLAAIAASLFGHAVGAETEDSALVQRDHLWGFQVYDSTDCTGSQIGDTVEGSLSSERSNIGGNSLYIKHNVGNNFAFWTLSGSDNKGSCDGSLQRSPRESGDCSYLNYMAVAGQCVRVPFASVTVDQRVNQHNWNRCSNDREVLHYDGNTITAVCPKTEEED